MISKEVRNFCILASITAEQFYGIDAVIRNLYLPHVTSIPSGFSPIIPGHLSLNRLITIPDEFSPIVGGDLFLTSITSISVDFSAIVSGTLHLPYNLNWYTYTRKDLFLLKEEFIYKKYLYAIKRAK